MLPRWQWWPQWQRERELGRWPKPPSWTLWRKRKRRWRTALWLQRPGWNSRVSNGARCYQTRQRRRKLSWALRSSGTEPSTVWSAWVPPSTTLSQRSWTTNTPSCDTWLEISGTWTRSCSIGTCSVTTPQCSTSTTPTLTRSWTFDSNPSSSLLNNWPNNNKKKIRRWRVLL